MIDPLDMTPEEVAAVELMRGEIQQDANDLEDFRWTHEATCRSIGLEPWQATDEEWMAWFRANMREAR